jgi:hypothetical protein
MEYSIEVNGRYKTLFEGLKLNQPHNSAVTYLFAFMLRRLVFAVAIVFMAHMPQIASLVMLCVSVAMLAFILVENPWKDPEHQKLDIANEIFLILVLTLILTCNCLTDTKSAQSEAFGWMLIGLLTLVIYVNLVVIIAQAYQHCKLL